MSEITTTKKWLFSIIIFLFLYALVEALSFAAYFAWKREAFSFLKFNQQRTEMIAKTENSDLVGSQAQAREPGKITEVLHPYLGYVHNPDIMDDRSQYGFPIVKTDAQATEAEKEYDVTVAVFGGSFAGGVGKYAREALIKSLNKYPAFSNKTIQYVDLALPGYKQPQQLMTLSYFLSMGKKFDIVINLDGFNEVSLPIPENVSKNVNPFYPIKWSRRVESVPDADLLSLIGSIQVIFEKRVLWAKRIHYSPLRYSVTFNLLWKLNDIRWINEANQKRLEIQQLRTDRENNPGYLASGPAFTSDSDDDQYDAFVKMWADSAVQMYYLSKSNDMAYFHFLQPNQYVPNSKIIKPKEGKVALSDSQPYKEGVLKGYPRLTKAGKDLAAKGIPFTDLTMVFQKNDKILYNDDCCHLNKHGYELIAAEIAKVVAANSK